MGLVRHDIETRRLLLKRVDSNGRPLLTLAAVAAVFLIVMSVVTIAMTRLLAEEEDKTGR